MAEQNEQNEEKVLRVYNGQFCKGKRLSSRRSDMGSWRVTTERLHFRFAGIGKYEGSIYYDDIATMQLVSLGYYFLIFKDGYEFRGRTTIDTPTCFVGVSLTKVKEFESVVREKIADGVLLPPSKKVYTSLIVPGIFLAILVILLVFIIYAGATAA